MKKQNFGWLTIFLISLGSFNVYADKDKAASDESEKTKAGKIVSTSRTLPSFNAISLSGIGNLYIKQSKQQNFTVEAEDKLLSAVVVYVKDKTLYIDLKDSSASNKSKLNYYLSIKDLQKIESFSNSAIFISDGFESKVLNLSLSGFGEANIKINVEKLIAQIDGGSKLEAKGIAKGQEITIKGAGEFNGSKLAGQEASISIDGSGAAKTHVTDNLSLKISGEGDIKYCERPTINRNITGNGVVSPLAESECQL